MPDPTNSVPEPIWDDVRAALDAEAYPGRPIYGQGRTLLEVVNQATQVLLTHVALGDLHEAPLLECKPVDAPRGGQGLALYVRGEQEPRWTT